MMIKQTQFPDPETSASRDAAIAADPRGAGVSPAVDGFQQITEGNSHEGFPEAVGADETEAAELGQQSKTLQKHYRYSSGEITNLNLKAQRRHFDDPGNATPRALPPSMPPTIPSPACTPQSAIRNPQSALASHASDEKTKEELEAT
ncbi:MAG: hypothetical protein ACR2IE_16580 [Candidatus Sumerlaeaceae bacterium]